MSAIRVRTPRLMLFPESAAWRATMCSIRLVGTHSAYRQKIMPSRTTCTRKRSQRRILRALSSRFSLSASPSTGAVRSAPLIRNTTSGRSGFSSSSLRTVWPTKKRCPSTGAPPANAFWQTKRLSTASVSAAAVKLFTRSNPSGC